MTTLFAALACIVLLAGLAARRRVADRTARERGPGVDDDAIRRIQDEGYLSADEEDEPLDLDEIAREEERFWDETWDEPDEFS